MPKALPSIDFIDATVASRGGRRVSKKIRSAKTSMDWVCGNGHPFSMSWDRVKTGYWCPECSKSFGERVCRVYFEALFGELFPATRALSWLVGENGRRLELDGYCEKLKIGFEHQGEQHYRKLGGIYRGKLKKIQARDTLKRALCRENGIILIEIREIPNVIKLDNARHAIVQECKRAGVKVRKDWAVMSIDLTAAWLPAENNIHADLSRIAEDNNGALLSPAFLGWHVQLKWKCEEETHAPFFGSPHSVKQGRWCKKCRIKSHAEKQRHTSDTVRQKIESAGFEWIGGEYLNAHSKLSLRCKLGHPFESTLTQIVSQGTKCTTCSRERTAASRRFTLEEIRDLCITEGFVLLSTSYSSGKPIEVRCRCGYVHNIEKFYKGRLKCPKCARERVTAFHRGSIAEADSVAEKRDGRCLSVAYINAREPLWWSCGRDHPPFQKSLDKAKRGDWCPECYKERRSRLVREAWVTRRANAETKRRAALKKKR